MITTELIKELRDQTGISIMQCKKALEEADGDKEKALIILRKTAEKAPAKKSDSGPYKPPSGTGY
jgi:elongation factor Ts